jgi:hypothetical protein
MSLRSIQKLQQYDAPRFASFAVRSSLATIPRKADALKSAAMQ